MMKIKVPTARKTGKIKKEIEVIHTTGTLTVDPGQDSWQIVKRRVRDYSEKQATSHHMGGFSRDKTNLISFSDMPVAGTSGKYTGQNILGLE